MVRSKSTIRVAKRELVRRPVIDRPARLSVESLEPRLLLYATSGGAWPHPELVTISFMPDGTDDGGLPTTLFSTMNARFPTATWQKEILRGLQSYAANANLNFSIVADDGSPVGSPGYDPTDHNVQGDDDFGDIRIGAASLGVPLGGAWLPPWIIDDTAAGDFDLNDAVAWNIGTSYDLYTVTAHEAGHSLGLCHSEVSTAVLYYGYNGVKSNLTSDDIAGIQAIYGARPKDAFDSAGSNETKGSSTVITSYIDANKQVSLPNLDITTTADVDWYKITIPSGHSGTMTVSVQSSGLSLFAPKFTLYKGTTNKGTVSGTYNSTISMSQAISNGQNWFIKVEAAETTVFGTGRYALQVNVGAGTQSPVSSPNTDTPAGNNLQPGCDSSQHDHDHDHDAAGSVPGDEAAIETTVVTTSDESNVSAKTQTRTTLALNTQFDFERSPFADMLRRSTGVDTIATSNQEKDAGHAALIDLALDAGLDGLLNASLI
jgi:hypothetical protein